MSDSPTPGEIAYEAYAAQDTPSQVPSLPFRLRNMRWHELLPREQAAWEAAAQAVLDAAAQAVLAAAARGAPP